MVTKWEYRAAAFTSEVSVDKIDGSTGRPAIETHLNQQGAYGWELVSAIQSADGSTVFYFKKPVVE